MADEKVFGLRQHRKNIVCLFKVNLDVPTRQAVLVELVLLQGKNGQTHLLRKVAHHPVGGIAQVDDRRAPFVQRGQDVLREVF